MHTFTLSVAQSSLPWWLWNHSERQPLQNVMSQATWAPTSAVRCWNNGRTCSAALCPWNPLHLFWQFQLMLKWNGIFLMKFIATVHLLFNMFSVPSALLCIITGTLSVGQEIPNWHSTCFKLFSFTDSCSKRCHVQCCLVSICSNSDCIWNQHAAWSKQQQCHARSSCLSFGHHPVWKDCTQTGVVRNFFYLHRLEFILKSY